MVKSLSPTSDETWEYLIIGIGTLTLNKAVIGIVFLRKVSSFDYRVLLLFVLFLYSEREHPIPACWLLIICHWHPFLLGTIPHCWYQKMPTTSFISLNFFNASDIYCQSSASLLYVFHHWVVLFLIGKIFGHYRGKFTTILFVNAQIKLFLISTPTILVKASEYVFKTFIKLHLCVNSVWFLQFCDNIFGGI